MRSLPEVSAGWRGSPRFVCMQIICCLRNKNVKCATENVMIDRGACLVIAYIVDKNYR